MNRRVQTAVVAVGILVAGGLGASVSRAQSPGLEDIAKLAKAHVSDEIILSYIHSSHASYNLTADDIVYLNGQGVSQGVISALLQSKSTGGPVPAPSAPAQPLPAPSTPAPAVAPADSTPPPPSGLDTAQPEVNADYFHDQLAPYGSWVDVPGTGPCWRPDGALAQNPDWRPYCDYGHWVYTDEGWFWQSDYRWGAIAFHYGRWFIDSAFGWVWYPDYVWGPSWVAWRYTDGYCGWAPLPPGAVFDARLGIVYHGRSGVDLTFGLSVGAFTFVGYDHFWEAHDLRIYAVPRDRVGGIFRDSHIVNSYHVVNGHFVNEGMGRDRIEHFTGRRVDEVRADSVRKTLPRHDDTVRDGVRSQGDRGVDRSGREYDDRRGTAGRDSGDRGDRGDHSRDGGDRSQDGR
jgi:hypothetical protein